MHSSFKPSSIIGLFACLLFAVCSINPAYASVIVNSDTDETDADCTIRDAIKAIELGTDFNDCTHNGDGLDKITFDPSVSMIELDGEALHINASMEISGTEDNPIVLIPSTRSTIAHRLITATNADATLTLTHLILTQGDSRTTPTSDPCNGKGGAICTTGSLVLKNAYLFVNKSRSAGAVYVQKDLTATNSIFEGNKANQASAIIANQITLTNNTVKSHRPEFADSVIRVEQTNGNSSIENSVFEDNHGSVLRINATANISNTQFKNNRIQSGEHLIEQSQTNENIVITMDRVLFDDNGTLGLKGAFEINQSTIRNHTGNATLFNGILTIRNSLIEDNTGGFVLRRHALFENVAIERNTAPASLLDTTHAQLEIRQTSIVNNTSQKTLVGLPALIFADDGDDAVLEGNTSAFNSTFSGNIIQEGNVLDGFELAISHNTFVNNTVPGYAIEVIQYPGDADGGRQRNRSGKIKLQNSLFFANGVAATNEDRTRYCHVRAEDLRQVIANIEVNVFHDLSPDEAEHFCGNTLSGNAPILAILRRQDIGRRPYPLSANPFFPEFTSEPVGALQTLPCRQAVGWEQNHCLKGNPLIVDEGSPANKNKSNAAFDGAQALSLGVAVKDQQGFSRTRFNNDARVYPEIGALEYRNNQSTNETVTVTYFKSRRSSSRLECDNAQNLVVSHRSNSTKYEYEYNIGDRVECHAQVGEGLLLVDWSYSPCENSTATTCAFNITQSTSLSFILKADPSFTHNVIIDNSSRGRIECDPMQYQGGDGVACNATPNPGFAFKEWQGLCTFFSSGGDRCYAFNLASDLFVSARFDESDERFFQVQRIRPNNGNIFCYPSDLNIAEGSTVTCNASAQSGYFVQAWGGDCTGTNNNQACVFGSLDTDKVITINVAPIPADSYSVNINPSENGNVVCTRNLVGFQGSVQCAATADPGYEVDEWVGACSGQTGFSCRLNNIDSNQVLGATFKAIDNVTLLNIDTIQTSNGCVSCDKTAVRPGGAATCTATPNANFALDEWLGACSGQTNNTCTLNNISGNQSISASFKSTDNNDALLVFTNGFE